MRFWNQLSQPKQQRAQITRWGGLNRRAGAAENEFADMSGFCADAYPAMTTAKDMIGHRTGGWIQGMIGGEELLVVMDGYLISYPETEDGLRVDLGIDGDHEVQLVRMGAYIAVFPDRVIYNSADGTVTAMDAVYSLTTPVSISYKLARRDGTEFEDYTASDAAPSDPEGGQLWLDTSGDTAAMKQWDENLAAWVPVAETCVKIFGMTNFYKYGFRKGDGVVISGIGAENEEVAALNGAKIIESIGTAQIVVAGILTRNYSETTLITISRAAPDMDYVIECGNRLWGCKYGVVDGELVNEIYACALGDPTNWRKYQGLASDSYAASRGSDGAWTGAITYGGYPYFFKKGWREKVYPSSYGAHQIVAIPCDGVESGKTLAIVGGTLIWQSGRGVIAFDGSTARRLDDPGNEIHGAVGCGCGEKYYLYADSGAEGDDGVAEYPVYVYHMGTKLWHIEQALSQYPARIAALGGGTLYVASEGTIPTLIHYHDDSLIPGTSDPWEAVTAVWGSDSPDHKYVRRLNLRFSLAKNGTLDLYIRYDSGGDWEHKCHVEGSGVLLTRTAVILPKRCDHMELKLKGHGDFTLLSMAKITEGGSDSL